MDERIDRTRMIGKLTSAFPSVAVTEETINTYVDALWDVPRYLLSKAIDAALYDANYLPTIAEIKAKANALMTGEYKSPVAVNCSLCFGAGMELYQDDAGYNVYRRCFH